ncbi:MAG: hypothetical protein FJW20_02055 [Acidimicrobiia bacterium]|nr:hypothetical protein [Acidimicrobiia bacterium]
MKERILPLSIGLLAVVAIVGGILFFTRGSHIRLTGGIQKVRTQPMEDTSTVVIADFRFVNPANYPFVVRSVEMFIEDENGKQLESSMSVSEPDARRMFDYYKMLGPKYNDTFTIREKVPAGASMDRMLAARFEVPAPIIEKRRKLWIRVEDVDGAVSTLEEGKP